MVFPLQCYSSSRNKRKEVTLESLFWEDCIMVWVFALISGALMAIQGSLNTVLGKVIGLLAATFVVQFVGASFTLLLLLCKVQRAQWDLLGEAPWYTYLGGLLGIGIIYLVVLSIQKVGVAPATTMIILGQVTTALLIDHFGLFGLEEISFHWHKGLGVVVLALGAYLLLKP